MRILLTLLMLPVAAFAQGMDRNVEIQFQRLDSVMQRLAKENDDLRQQMRQLQRANDELDAKNDELNTKLDELADELLTVTNTDIANLAGNQQRLFNDVPIFNWGSETRPCPNLGEHQQIKMVQSPDQTHTLRYLCFDGRVLHLGTEVHQPPE